ncbi:hypothetical protein BC938DRAFT_474913 [Jimgerdemannia flammicorona]|uniref:Uncharacterized protein n=1 Tax=Jimgerdemannia flammicorona TaxID=994334 RepID=A0A433Q1A8_9FUNG|nr:hypothetical protein BC938DRAFT_474913 [Jimgerdemannia flammicorona]
MLQSNYIESLKPSSPQRVACFSHLRFLIHSTLTPMRTVSLVNRLKWSFTGNLNPHAFAIGDADNDGDNEFVLGNLNGDLAIFKGECLSSSCRGLGTKVYWMLCIIDNMRGYRRYPKPRQGKLKSSPSPSSSFHTPSSPTYSPSSAQNSVVCINAEGQAHIFDLPNLHDYGDGSSISAHDDRATSLQSSRRNSFDAVSTSRTGRRGRGGGGGGGGVDGASSYAGQHHAHQNLLTRAMEKPSVTLSVPVNVNRVLIADIGRWWVWTGEGQTNGHPSTARYNTHFRSPPLHPQTATAKTSSS